MTWKLKQYNKVMVLKPYMPYTLIKQLIGMILPIS